MPKRIQLFINTILTTSQDRKNPRTRIRFIGLSHIQNGKSYEQVAQYLLQSLSAVSNGFDIIKMKVSMA
ncbi:hypothetical protein BSPWISOXPB_7255 [uncultured Gammaproteobacteria bacterium]|nr:hypothetical protein BSPWISOXPB_7255 [uncultured Gammaproteobacteria bacterium]